MPMESAPGQNRVRYSHSQFDPVVLADAKGGRSISVCIPARNEAATVGPVVHAITSALTGPAGGVPLVDEVLVVDDGSVDRTADVARTREPESSAPTPPMEGRGRPCGPPSRPVKVISSPSSTPT